jgi:diamine N-acetyltransferase
VNSEPTPLPLLPSHWQTGHLVMEDATLEDVPRLHAIFTACAYVEPWDPTFKLVPESELAELVNRSLATEGDHYRFKLQPIRTQAEEETIGYFHLHHGLPHPHLTSISMFVLHPDYQRHHFGQEVITGLAEQLRALGYTALSLRVYLKNWPALRFWISAGFTSITQYQGDPTLTATSQASLRVEKQLR